MIVAVAVIDATGTQTRVKDQPLWCVIHYDKFELQNEIACIVGTSGALEAIFPKRRVHYKNTRHVFKNELPFFISGYIGIERPKVKRSEVKRSEVERSEVKPEKESDATGETLNESPHASAPDAPQPKG